ncbi:oligodendrocyte-myelin glycoprotein-like [Periophthalmus magnuspinnatus]|uniref:oligodendrocyte-myelin glycoprotein-like n=1 Tax=Periophthalmus magnuspinnatus TaxID=409849 RepID=UPI00145A0FD9|nr:oligodendrocyte-myelin glycoprotein-like [Periophthalmus magnuspinnatus]
MRRNVLLKRSPNKALLELLLLLLLGWRVLAVCPSMCTCSRSHREVDCSWRGLRLLPDGLQYNLRTLNLSHNRFHNLDIHLTPYTHLRVLDLSYNRLIHLPAGLPRSLWQLYASYNRVQLLEKNDTAYQWNLQVLDLSYNKLERAVFINNTLINLRTLNLSHNHFWTIPTNMPAQLDTIDLSNNLLVRVLPGSLDRLPRLTHFYLQANRFTTMSFGVLDKLTSLRIIHLGSNPWACHVPNEIAYIAYWAQQTSARVLGCPCHTQSICGGVRAGRTGGWHFASYDLPPLAASAQGHNSMTPRASESGKWYQPYTTQDYMTTPYYPIYPTFSTNNKLTLQTIEDFLDTDSYLHVTETSPISDTSDITDMADVTLAANTYFTTESPSTHTKKTTTLRTRSVRRQNPGGGISKSGSALAMCSTLLHSLGLLSIIILQQGL